jgi:hypothetical protein
VSQQPANTGAFVGGIIVGLLVGGSVLALVAFVIFGVIADTFAKSAAGLAFVFEYLVAILIGIGGIMVARRNVGFAGGLLIGLAAGMLGGTAFCNVLVGGLGHIQ